MPVPNLPGKVFWCWFDAPLGYLSLAADGWSSSATITQFLGKDNAPFHTVWLPAILAATDTRTPDVIHALHWLNWYGGKFSTSQQRGVFLDRALELLPPDVWRWGLLAQCPETEDSRFTWEQLAATVNKDLVGQLGNFVHRVQRLNARLGTTVPSGTSTDLDTASLQGSVHDIVRRLTAAYDSRAFRRVIGHLRDLTHVANRYVDQEAPWALLSSDRPRAEAVLRTCFQLVRLMAGAAGPVIPFTSERLFDLVSATVQERRAPVAELARLEGLGGRPIRETPPLFERLDPQVK